jgi:protein TonB
VVPGLRFFRQHFSALGIAGSLSLHGLGIALVLTRAPAGAEPPTGGGSTQGAITVTLVSAAQASTVASSPLVGSLTKASEQRPVMRSDQVLAVADTVGVRMDDGEGDGKLPVNGDRAAQQPASVNSAMGSDYRARLLAHIQPFRRYPDQAEVLDAKGVTQLIFMVDQDGKVMGVWVKSSSGFETLDNEAMATVLRAQPMPHVPHGLPSPLTVQLPVSFNPS